MRKAVINLSGLVTVRREVSGVSVRALNFADLSALWQIKGTEIMAAYDRIVKEGKTAQSQDVISLVNDLIVFAPELARDAFLKAIDDDGQVHEAGFDENGLPIMMTAADVWDNEMGLGKQLEVLIAIIELTVSEMDTLKKSQAIGSFQNAVLQAMTPTQTQS